MNMPESGFPRRRRRRRKGRRRRRRRQVYSGANKED